MAAEAKGGRDHSEARRILIKISGEALSGAGGFGIDPHVLRELGQNILEVQNNGVQTALVIGGGNIFRGAELQKSGFDRVAGDQLGMLATVMNALALKEQLRALGGKCEVMNAYGIPSIAAQYHIGSARALLAEGTAVIVSGGTGAPFFTTDTAAVLRAIELNCAEVLKATKVDGVYSADPLRDPAAERFDTLSFAEVLKRELKVMDLTAFALAREHHMPIRVFSITKSGAFKKAALGKKEGTLVSD